MIRRAVLPPLLRAARPRAGSLRALVNWLRVSFVGGLLGYRALFGWLNPWIYVPILIVYRSSRSSSSPTSGAAAELESDTFFVVGNAL